MRTNKHSIFAIRRSNPAFSSAPDRELLHTYFNSKVGFADESIFLAKQELEFRGYKFGTLGNIVGWEC